MHQNKRPKLIVYGLTPSHVPDLMELSDQYNVQHFDIARVRNDGVASLVVNSNEDA